jgi:hypothetical protein
LFVLGAEPREFSARLRAVELIQIEVQTEETVGAISAAGALSSLARLL